MEIPAFEGMREYFSRIGDVLDKLDLERSVVSVIGASSRNPLSVGKPARAYLRFRWSGIS